MIFAPLARGAVRLWSMAPLELVILLLVFLWLWRVNNREIEDGSRKTKKEEQGIRRTQLDLPIWLFVGLAGISCFFSIYKYAGLLEMLRLLTMVGVFYLVVNNFDRRMRLRLATLVIIMGAGMSLLGLGQYFCGLTHFWWGADEFLTSTYVNHNHFAGYLEMAIPLAIGILIGLKRDGVSSDFQFLSFRIGLAGALLIMIAALVFSQSRGAWVCLTVSLIIMNIALVKGQILKRQSLFVFLLLIALGIAFIGGGYDAVSKRLGTAKEINKAEFIETRKKVWQGSIDMIKANPLIGTGIGTFVWGFPGYRPKGLAGVRAHCAHSDFLHMMTEMGVLALPLMVWMIGVVIYKGFRYSSRPTFGLSDGIVLGGTVGILSLALHGLADFNFHIPANMLLVACFAGVIMKKTRISTD